MPVVFNVSLPLVFLGKGKTEIRQDQSRPDSKGENLRSQIVDWVYTVFLVSSLRTRGNSDDEIYCRDKYLRNNFCLVGTSDGVGNEYLVCSSRRTPDL